MYVIVHIRVCVCVCVCVCLSNMGNPTQSISQTYLLKLIQEVDLHPREGERQDSQKDVPDGRTDNEVLDSSEKGHSLIDHATAAQHCNVHNVYRESKDDGNQDASGGCFRR